MHMLRHVIQHTNNCNRLKAALALAALLLTALDAQAQRGEDRMNWPVHNLDLNGSRYAALNTINSENVNQLELVWAFKPEAEHIITQVTPLVIDEVMYLNDADGLVFALDATTGEILWTVTLGDDPTSLVSRPRGPTYGDGRLYAFVGTTLFALDAQTGDSITSFGQNGQLDIVAEALHTKYPDQYPPNLDPRSLGHQMTAPPAYYENTLYAGVGLSDQHIPGGLVIAADATTGTLKWIFNTVPQRPGDDGWEIAEKTWGTGKRAGGGVWTTPAIDPDLGLVYVNAGNPSADYDGSARPGINLFTNATIALDLETGKLAWYYQTVHHDVWDLDHVTGPLLFDAVKDGRSVKGVAAGGKNCLLYLWDRATGQPINPMVEMAVPTETDVPGEQIWPTQPFPYTARGIPMSPFCNTYPIVNNPATRDDARQIYTPYSTTDAYIVAHGGSSWGPPSFSPRTGLLYVSAKDGSIAATVKPVGDSVDIGRGLGGRTSMQTSRREDMPPEFTLSAYEPVSGSLVWQQRVPTNSPIGASGNFVTAGDIVLQGTDVGELYAFDARTGERLFQYQHNRPIRASPLTYQVRGTQFITVVATDTVLTFALP